MEGMRESDIGSGQRGRERCGRKGREGGKMDEWEKDGRKLKLVIVSGQAMILVQAPCPE